jgi:hypothetical protein
MPTAEQLVDFCRNAPKGAHLQKWFRETQGIQIKARQLKVPAQ